MSTPSRSPSQSHSAPIQTSSNEPSFNHSRLGHFPPLHQLFVSSYPKEDPVCSRRLIITRPHPQKSRPPLVETESVSQLVETDPLRDSLSFLSEDYNLDAGLHSTKFRPHHRLVKAFVELYKLEDEVGSGGYGFVMTARHRHGGYEVAVKFIIKSKVPAHSWIYDSLIGKIPTEVVVLTLVDHENIVKCLDIFEDSEYFYLVQELHGSPWTETDILADGLTPDSTATSISTPPLSCSGSVESLESTPPTTPPRLNSTYNPPSQIDEYHEVDAHPPPKFSRRPSYDLFECVTQAPQQRFTESQARDVFHQIVDAVQYLNDLGIAHRDIKDENILIDKNFKIKLIDFGSAIIINPTDPDALHTEFFGTPHYAASEILRKKPYHAAPPEIWTLGVLLSYLLTGTSPFANLWDAMDGRIVLSRSVGPLPSKEAVDLMKRCLDPDPATRATVREVREHSWLTRRSAVE